MAIPTHDQILAGLSGKQVSTQPLVPLPTPKKPTLAQRGVAALKATPAFLKDILTPTRGFSDEQINKAKPTLKDAAVGVGRFGAELAKIPTDLYSAAKSVTPTNVKQAVRGYVPGAALVDDAIDSTVSKNIYNTVDTFAKPKTAEEAKTMRFADIASLGIGGTAKSLTKAIEKIAASTEASAIARELKAVGVADDAAQRYLPDLIKETDQKRVSDIVTSALRDTSNEARRTLPTAKAVQDEAADRPIAPKGTSEDISQASTREQGAAPLPTIKAQAEAESNSALSAIDAAKTRTLEVMQDSNERVRQLVGNKDLRITDVNDPYLKMTLFHGRVGTAIEQGARETQAAIDDIARLSKETGKPLKDTRTLVNEYLIAKHAPERNAALKREGAAGITTKDAAQKVRAIESSKEGKQVKDIANRLLLLHTRTLEMLKTSGVISKDMFDTLRARYKNHVPLQRIMDDSEDIGSILSGKGFDVRTSGIKRAVGSDREVADIVANIVKNYEEAVLRSNKNVVDSATLQFVRDNKEALKGLMEEVKLPSRPVATIKNADDLDETIYRAQQFTNDPTILTMMEDGKRVFIKVKDPRLATAFRGVNQEKLPVLFQVTGAIVRYLSSLATRFNPEFFAPNKIRDLQETAVYIASQKNMGFGAAGKTVTRDAASIKDVIDFQLGRDTAGAKLYKEMKEMGGTTGGFGLSTRKQVEMNIEKMEKLATSNPRRAVSKVFEYVDNWNEIFEDSTRLSVYKTALDKGLSKERAAQLAKDASINFNRMGTGGPVLSSLWMFSNASIQGSTKTLRAMKNPKVAAAVVTSVVASVAAVNQFNDNVDPNWRGKVSTYDRQNGLPIMIPNEDPEKITYFTLPMAWGLKPIKVMADYAYDAASGQEVDPGKAVEEFLLTVMNAYNPLGGTDFFSTIMPTPFDAATDIARNRTWSGSSIRPNFNPNAPESIKYYDSLEETATGRAMIKGSEALSNLGIEVSPANMKYALDQIIGGAGRSVTSVANTVSSIGKGVVPPVSDFPILRRFFRERDLSEIGSGSGDYDAIKLLKQRDAKESFNRTKDAKAEWEKIKQLPTEQKKAALKEIAATDEKLAEKILDVAEEESAGLTSTERQLKSATVATRAEYIAQQVSLLKTREEKKALLKEYAAKKILTEAVLDELEIVLGKQK